MRASVSAATAAMVLGLGLGAGGAANAATTLFDFSGVCRDCASVGTGTLVLNGAPNGPISTADFVSFSYKSNLVSFTLDKSNIVAMLGSFDPSRPGAEVIDIVQLGGTGWEFERNADGSWSVSSEIGASRQSGDGAGGSGGGGGFSFASGGEGGGSPGASGGGLTSFDGAGGGISDWGSSNGGSSDGGSTRVVDDFGPSSSFQQQLVDVAASVPEPASWALMMVGFGGLGAALRRRRLAVAI